jgi:hypothetical protein
MRVLLTETEAGDGSGAAHALSAAGHDVVRCRAEGTATFPCAALRPDEHCPLEGTVDVVLAVRRGATAPTLREDGVTCGLRHHLPLVVDDPENLNPFRDWTTVTIEDGDVVEACERAAAAALADLSRAASDEVRRALDLDRDDDPSVGAAVYRRGDRLLVDLSLPPGLTGEEAHRVGVRAAGAVRRVDPHAPKIDVSH